MIGGKKWFFLFAVFGLLFLLVLKLVKMVLGFWSFAMTYKLVAMKMFRLCGKCSEEPSRKWHLSTRSASADHCGGFLYGPPIVLTHPSPQIMLINRQLCYIFNNNKSIWRVKTRVWRFHFLSPTGWYNLRYGTKAIVCPYQHRMKYIYYTSIASMTITRLSMMVSFVNIPSLWWSAIMLQH